VDYPAASLNFLTKKKKWYVYVSVPTDLREKFGAQVRRSTGTSDKKAAERKLHEIAASIYADFDNARPNQFLGLLDKLQDLMKGPPEHYDLIKLMLTHPEYGPDNRANYIEELKIDLRRGVGMQLVPSPTEPNVYVDRDGQQKRDLIDQLDALLVKEGSKEDQPTFAKIAQTYIEQTNFTREQIKKQSILATDEFAAFIGPDKPITEIAAKHLYAYAEHLSTTIGLAKTTIRGRIDRVSLVFHEAVRKGLVLANPCLRLRLTGLGKESEPYKPFTKQELASLFSLDLPPQERLVLQCLAMSGMRLDEVALLVWDELTEEDGIRLFDLTKRPTLRKNKGSARKIPLHPSLALPKRGSPTQRLFDYPLNADGKTTTASERLMSYVRQVTDDPLKVVHSLRHTFKDAMRDAGVSKETSDFLSGHASGDVAGKYGRGPSIKTRYEAISKLPVPW
jgi:integrase